MAKHDLSMDDIDVRESGTRRKDMGLDPLLRAHIIHVANAIAHLVGARFWVNGSGGTATVGTFFGLPHDVEVAEYLMEVCENAMRRDLAAFERSTGTVLLVRRHKERKAASFLAGMAQRLATRIREMSEVRAGGNALVPLKDALINEALREAGIGLGKARVGRRDTDLRSFAIGPLVIGSFSSPASRRRRVRMPFGRRIWLPRKLSSNALEATSGRIVEVFTEESLSRSASLQD